MLREDQLPSVSPCRSPQTQESTIPQIRVAIADSRSVLRTGLIHTIESEPQMRVVLSAERCCDLTAALQQRDTDVLVIDPVDVGDAPVRLVRDLLANFPYLKIVVFSPLVEFVSECIEVGVLAYVVHDEPAEQLILGVRAAMARRQFLSPATQNYVDEHAWLKDAPLSPRESMCLVLIAQGLDNQTIAFHMGVRLRTVENYVAKLRAKTGCDTRLQMIAWCRQVHGTDVEVRDEPHVNDDP